MIERASATDLAMLATDAGPTPQHLGAVLVLDAGPGFDLSAAEGLLAERIRAVPRLRQRLRRPPPGCGRPIWVDDPDFDVANHLRRIDCPPPGDEQALLDVAAAVLSEPLPRSRPPWSAALVTGLAGGAVALVVVFHHVLADGMGGLAALLRFVDQAGAPPTATPPAPQPTSRQLAVDAMLRRLRALSRVPALWREVRSSVSAAGGLRAPRATRCSLLQPTGPRRRVAVVRADLEELRAAAHRHDGTVNDAVLSAATGALHKLLERRGESIDEFAVSVPVAGRASASATQLGNQIGLLLVLLPGAGDSAARLRRIAATTRAHRASATGPPPIALLGPVFRAAARLGLYRWYMRHQRRAHTLVTNVRGPGQPLSFAGAAVRAVIPLAIGEAGNITVSFDVLSYAGTLTIAVVADPDHVPDLPGLATLLRAELAALTSSPATSPSPV